MSLSRCSRTLAAAALCALAWSAHGAVDVQIANNAQVQSELVNPGGIQRYRVYLPAGAKLTAAVKGKKDKARGLPAPPMRLRVLDEFEDDVIADGFLDKAKLTTSTFGAKAKVTVEDAGEYIVEAFSEDASLGAFTLSAKWVSPKVQRIKDELFFEGDETDVEVSVDGDAQLTMSVKKSGRSTARPFFDLIDFLDGEDFDSQDLADAPKLKKITVLEGGDCFIVIGNESGEGAIAGSVRIKQPRTKKVTIPIAPVRGDEKKVTGKVAVPSKSVLVEADDEDVVGPDIVGSSVLVPAGALTQPTSIQIGTSDPLPPPTAEAGVGAGPTVFFGPPGLQFEVPVTVTIPFDADLLEGGDVTDLSVYTADEDGNVEEIDGFDVDVDDESVSFPVSHFSSFRVFISGVKRGAADLDGDGTDDIVLPAPAAADGAGRVYVFSGAPEDGVDTSEATYTIRGAGSEQLGRGVATGDVNNDGRADLIVLAEGAQAGACLVFAGGPSFRSTGSNGATIRLGGVSGLGSMTSVAAGDVNGDGIDDIVVGAEDGANGAGAVVVWFGGSGLASKTSANADLTFTGAQVGDLFGASVAAGDVNGDGRDDVVVGADMIDSPGRAGAVYVQRGGSGIQGAGAAGMDFVLTGSGANAGFGLNVAVGDVTGDTTPDLVVTELDDDLGGPGAVFVFAGGSSFGSLQSTADATGVYRGTQDEALGSALLLMDVTGDTVLDLILGARGAATGDGGIYVFTGGASVVGANVGVGAPDISGPGFFEGFPLLAQPLRVGRAPAILAFAPGNEDAEIAAGAAYLFLGDPRGQQQGLTTDDAAVTIFGQADDALGGEQF